MEIFKWRITDDLNNISVDDLKENQGIYGFLKFTFNNINLGYVVDDENIEGNNDILYWVIKALLCLNSINNHKDFSQRLFSSNLVEINVEYGETIIIKTVDHITKKVYNQETIGYNDLKKYVLEFADNFLNEIESINPDLLSSEEVIRVIELRNTVAVEEAMK